MFHSFVFLASEVQLCICYGTQLQQTGSHICSPFSVGSASSDVVQIAFQHGEVVALRVRCSGLALICAQSIACNS